MFGTINIILFRPGSRPKPQPSRFSGSYLICWEALWCPIKSWSSSSWRVPGPGSAPRQCCTSVHYRQTWFQPVKWFYFFISLHTSFFTLVFTPQSEQHDAGAAIAPWWVDGLCCLIVACADSPQCLALRSTLSQGCPHVRTRLGPSWRCGWCVTVDNGAACGTRR